MNKFKLLPLILASAFLYHDAMADTYVQGYYRADGSYVQGYYRSNPDQYRYNNRNSESNGGTQRDEYSSNYGATNKSNSGWGYRDNDNDGTMNSFDSSPSTKCRTFYCY